MEEQLKSLACSQRVGLSLGTKGALPPGFLCSLLLVFPKDNVVSQTLPSSTDLEFSSLLEVMLNQANPRWQCEGGNCVRATRTARKLKVQDPSANTGKEVKEKKQVWMGFLTVGCHLIRGARGSWKEKWEKQVQGSA